VLRAQCPYYEQREKNAKLRAVIKTIVKLPEDTITTSGTIKAFDLLRAGGRVFNVIVTSIRFRESCPRDERQGYDVTIEGVTTGAPIKEADDD